MAARHTIWRWLGVVADVRGRLEALGLVLSVLAAIGFGIWRLVLSEPGALGVGVLLLSASFGVLALIFLVALIRHRRLAVAGPSMETSEIAPVPPEGNDAEFIDGLHAA